MALGACGDESTPSDPLVDRMRDGGLVLLFRHAATDSSADMTADLGDCSRQRNLDGVGKRQARVIGRAIRRLGIPVDAVLASPFCRTMDTARLAFGRARSSDALLSPDFAPDSPRPPLRRLLMKPPAHGTNTVLVSHEAAIDSATGATIEEGDALVIEPGREGGDVLRRLKPSDWAALR
jgi:phosphohistidine phosphatase SixA